MYLDAPMVHVGSFVFVHVFVLFQWMKGKVVDHSCIFITVLWSNVSSTLSCHCMRGDHMGSLTVYIYIYILS
jgi:hypothetical protein